VLLVAGFVAGCAERNEQMRIIMPGSNPFSGSAVPAILSVVNVKLPRRSAIPALVSVALKNLETLALPLRGEEEFGVGHRVLVCSGQRFWVSLQFHW
jgi:hypothetical protein